MKTPRIYLAALMMTGMVFMNACKDDEESPNMGEQIAEEEAAMDEMANLIDIQLDATIGNDQELINTTFSKSASTVTYPIVSVDFPEQTLWPCVITLDYGTENTTVTVGSGVNAKEYDMRGKIIVTKSGPHYATGSEWDLTFDGFYINNNKIEGNQSYTNNGLNDSQQWMFTWTSDLKLTTPEGEWVERDVIKTRVMTAGASTPLNIWDDEFTINGTAVGANSKGWNYTHAISNVINKRTCRYPVSGKVTINNNMGTYFMDYGNGECDASATITDASGNVTTITFGRKWNRR
jgi:hypothetical protein